MLNLIADKTIIKCRDDLTDKHIQMAQNVLKCQFTLVEGLQHSETGTTCNWMHSKYYDTHHS